MHEISGKRNEGKPVVKKKLLCKFVGDKKGYIWCEGQGNFWGWDLSKGIKYLILTAHEPT